MKSFKQFISEKSLAGEEGDLIQHEGGRIDIHTNPQFAPRKQSVIDFVVPEKQRGKGLGHALLQKAMDKHNDLGAQVSSLASLKVFHNKGFRNPNIPNGSFDDHRKEFEENGGSLFVAQNDDKGTPYNKSSIKEEFLSEKLEDINGKVVGIDELSKHLTKTQLKNLVNHPWHKTYASHSSDKPTAYRVLKHPTLSDDFSIEAGHGVPRNKETFGDKEDVRHMVSFRYHKNKIHNADLFHNTGDQRHPETGKKVWVWKRSHHEDKEG